MLRAPQISSSRGAHIALLLALLLAALLRLPECTLPWFGHHTAWGGAMYGNIARNYVIYGYLATGFGPVANFGPVEPSQFEYYYHYPPLLVWLVSVSFHWFGVSEWSARLVPLLFSLLAVSLTFDLGRRLSGDLRVAAIAAGLSAAMPMGVIYGTHVDVYGPPGVTLTLLVFNGYVRWLQSRSAAALALLFTGVVLGCMTAWFTYFAALLLQVHNWVFESPARRFPWRVALGFAALPLVVFGAFLAHRWSLGVGAGNEVYGTLWQKLLVRTSYADLPKPLLAVWSGHARDTLRLYTPLALALCGLWLLRVVLRAAVRRSLPDSATWLLLALLGYGVLHNLAFPSLLVNHDFMAGAYAAGLAITAAMATVGITDWIAAKRRGARALALAGALAVVGSAAASSWKAVRTDSEEVVARVKRLGEAIRGSTGEKELVVVPIAEDRVLQFYAQREMVFGVTEPAALTALPAAPHGRAFVAAAEWLERRPALRAHLEEHCARRATSPLVVFDLSTAAQPSLPNNAASRRRPHD